MVSKKFIPGFIYICLLSLCFCVPLCLADPTEKEPVKEKSEPAVEEKGGGEKEPMTKQYEQEINDLKDKIEKQRQEIETMRKYEQEIDDLKAKTDKQREEQEQLQKQKAEMEKHIQVEQVQKSLEMQKEKLKKPTLTLKFSYGSLSGSEIPVALVHKGDKVTVKINKVAPRNKRESGRTGERLYFRVGPPEKIETYERVDKNNVRALNPEDSFNILESTETGTILYIGSTNNIYNPTWKRGTFSIEMDIYETNQWSIKPKKLL